MTCQEGTEGLLKYSTALSSTLVLDEGGWPMPRPSRFTPGKETRYPLYWKLGGTQGLYGPMWKISPLLEFVTRTVQHVTFRYTDYHNPTLKLSYIYIYVYI